MAAIVNDTNAQMPPAQSMHTSFASSIPPKPTGNDSMTNPFATQMQTTAATRQQQ